MKTKSIEEVEANFRSGAAVAPSRYAASVSKTTGVIAAAIAGEALWAQKMQTAIANKTRAKALAKVTDSTWQEAASGKGAQRIGPGMTAAADKQAANFTPYLAALQGINLPARTADPAQNVANRVTPIAITLAAKKRALLG